MYHIWYVSFRDLYIISDFFLTPLYVYVSLKKRMPNVAKTHIFKLIFIFFISKFSEASMNVPVFFKTNVIFLAIYLMVQALKG